MKKAILILILTGFAASHSVAGGTPDSTLNLIDKGFITAKMVKAKDELYTKDYRAALILYREVIEDDPKNAGAFYYMAECHYGLTNYEIALENMKKAEALDPKVNKDLDLLKGNINLRLENIDVALEAYTRFKATLKEPEIKDREINELIANCEVAKKLMANPLKVEIKNLGELINSHNDDYSPLPVADGTTLYFTSRRPSAGNSVAYEGDHKYFEDIYFSVKDDQGAWQQSEMAGGKLNVDQFDNCGHLSTDGSQMYITYNVLGWTKGGDIGLAKKSVAGTWGQGTLLPKKSVNSTYFEACPTLPADETFMYFVSDRPKGSNVIVDGDLNLWRVNMRKGKPAGAPVPMTSLNTQYHETTPWLHPSGKFIIFSSEGHGSMGGHDIFISEFIEGTWATPRNLGYPINSTDDDVFFRVSSDGKTAYFSSIRKGGRGEKDIYEVDISSLNLFAGSGK
ncbi:MAG: hypothetical protein ACHQF2_10930 [Flavobacteriales bacterium]